MTNTEKKKVTYDSKSFLLNGRRIWIVAGEIHYFRHPRAEWREALLRAKRAGLNTICTYVPWNFHETTEGHADFAGDNDLGAYIDLIGELGMYAMLRPGPYICSEWDGGGLPAWLCAKPLRRFREDDPVYMAAVESWFDRLLPIIAARQASNGGPVITVQNENEYPGGWDESMRRYIRKLNALFAKHGIDVPVVACNVHGDTLTTVKINDSTDARDQFIDPDMVLTYNHHTVVEPVYDLKSKQPNAPLVTTEFWCGAPLYWGDKVSDWPDRLELARAAYEYASSGTQVCYYMFDGGNNFGFWGGNNIATSYASGYPVGEGGRLTDKYYVSRPVNLFAGHFADFLADSEEREDKAGIAAPEGVRLVVRASDQGAIAFVSTADGRKELDIVLPEGRRLTVHLGDTSAAALPAALRLSDGASVDYSNLTLLAKDDAGKRLILFGPAGTEGVVSVNGCELRLAVGRRTVVHRELAGVGIVVVDEEMARRCWTVDDEIVFGPDYVGERRDDGALAVRVSDASPDLFRLDAAGKPVKLQPQRGDAAAPAALPELRDWRIASCAEPLLAIGERPEAPHAGISSAAGGSGQTTGGEAPSAAAEGWLPLDGPLSHERLGVVQGYLWYAAELDCETDGIEHLLLTHAPNRVSVFVNGQFCGTHAERRSIRMRDEYGHPADWAFEQLAVPVRKGRNRFVFLSDDLGHNYDVPVPVGIQGPVALGSRRVEIGGFRETEPLPVSDDALYFMYSRNCRTPEPLPAVEFELAVEAEELAFLTIHGPHAWVTVNGEELPPLSFPESPWTMFAQIKRWITWQLPESASGRTNTIRIQYAETTAQAVMEHMQVYKAPKSGVLSAWQWKRWAEDGNFAESQAVSGGVKEREGAIVLLPAGGRIARKGRALSPAYFETIFPMPDGKQPVYFDIGEMFKGQLFLNGHNVGRFWRQGGTQQRYYLPRAWMAEENRLVVFEELGLLPQNAALVDDGRELRTDAVLSPGQSGAGKGGERNGTD